MSHSEPLLPWVALFRCFVLATRKGTQTVSEKMKVLESGARGMQSILVCKKDPSGRKVKCLGSVSSGTWWQRWSWDSLWRQWGRPICRKRKNSCQNPQAWFEARKKCSVVAIYWEQMAMMEEVSLGRPWGHVTSNKTSHTQQWSLGFSPGFYDEIQT